MSDLNECHSYKLLSASLNDCHSNASCDNQPGYFDCVCNINFKDNSTDRDYLGRYCVGRSSRYFYCLSNAMRSVGQSIKLPECPCVRPCMRACVQLFLSYLPFTFPFSSLSPISSLSPLPFPFPSTFPFLFLFSIFLSLPVHLPLSIPHLFPFSFLFYFFFPLPFFPFLFSFTSPFLYRPFPLPTFLFASFSLPFLLSLFLSLFLSLPFSVQFKIFWFFFYQSKQLTVYIYTNCRIGFDGLRVRINIILLTQKKNWAFIFFCFWAYFLPMFFSVARSVFLFTLHIVFRRSVGPMSILPLGLLLVKFPELLCVEDRIRIF